MNNQQAACGTEESDTRLNAPPTCFQCNKYIYDGTIQRVKGQFWHNACLRCTVCHVQVNGTCHVLDQDVYCRADFIRLFGAKCSGCDKIISPSESARVVNGNVYHNACFTCETCRRPLRTGEYLYIREDGKLMCYQDYKQTTASDDSSPTDSESDESGSDEIGRNSRTCLNDNQLRLLEDTYQSTKRPTRSERENVSQRTGVTQRDIQLWFRNKRRSERRTKRSRVQNAAASGLTDNNTHTQQLPNMQAPLSSHQPAMTSHPFDETATSHYQLYCPLDYMLPGSMPPNIDLSSANICNGEIMMGKQTLCENKAAPGLQTNYFNDQIRQWLTV